ncbi:hypothetical protein MKZ38_005272 [Zalerion maritima]|uniref:Uncharacterized protein n=1 Tax=Zalerion maritima TaxID=339359 RepID=A0AAD5RLD8_9PEZI|nr:hypothetical protein MKZ38_005272 [Zalerion maritima]
MGCGVSRPRPHRPGDSPQLPASRSTANFRTPGYGGGGGSFGDPASGHRRLRHQTQFASGTSGFSRPRQDTARLPHSRTYTSLATEPASFAPPPRPWADSLHEKACPLRAATAQPGTRNRRGGRRGRDGPDPLASEISHTASLLRRLYGLDLEIWGMHDAVEEELDEKRELEEKANELLGEIKARVDRWYGGSGAEPGGGDVFTQEQAALVGQAWEKISAAKEQRYDFW